MLKHRCGPKKRQLFTKLPQARAAGQFVDSEAFTLNLRIIAFRHCTVVPIAFLLWPNPRTFRAINPSACPVEFGKLPGSVN